PPTRGTWSRIVRGTFRDRPWIATSVAWLAIYVALCSTGERFSKTFLDYGWQTLPLDLLRADPFGSVWYLHTQPPVMNLTVGIVERWSLAPRALSLQIILAVVGVCLAGMTTSLVQRLGRSSVCAFAVGLFATADPTIMRMAFSPTYELPTALCVVGVMWCLARGQSTAGRRLMICAVFATILVLTRSLYHPAWLIILLVALAIRWRKRIRWQQLMIVAALPTVLVGGWLLKNEIVFGDATLSSWSGMNLERSILPLLSSEQVDRAIADGDVSRSVLVGAFHTYDQYVSYVPRCRPSHTSAVTALSTRRKWVRSLGGPQVVANFNFECFLPIYRQAGQDALHLAIRYPGKWLEGRLWSTRGWFTEGRLEGGQKSPVLTVMDTIFSIAHVDVGITHLTQHGWGDGALFTGMGKVPIELLIFVVDAAVVLTALWTLLRRVRGHRTDTAGLLLIAGAFILAWSFVVGVTGELGEQSRFRSVLDPLAFALVAGVVVPRWRAALSPRWHRRRRRVDALTVAPSVSTGQSESTST
ncbi:MAG: hypothetical protein JWN39_1926, partial [Ilumatobacteraceae bacterium]|nr:hypothetical protein [Ilumatobacteraceae bacterium]